MPKEAATLPLSLAGPRADRDLYRWLYEELRAAIYATLRKLEEPESKPSERAAGAQPSAGETTKLIYLLLLDLHS